MYRCDMIILGFLVGGRWRFCKRSKDLEAIFAIVIVVLWVAGDSAGGWLGHVDFTNRWGRWGGGYSGIDDHYHYI